NQASVDPFPLLGEPLQDLSGSVDRGPLLVAGDQQRDAAFRLAPIFQIGSGARHEGCDRALHVAGATANHLPPFQTPREGIHGPLLEIPWRYHVGVSGEAEVRTAASQLGPEIVDLLRARFLERKTGTGEAERFQLRL